MCGRLIRLGDSILADWTVDRIVHFGSGDFVKNGFSHFGFHERTGNHYAIFHQKHSLGLIARAASTLLMRASIKGHFRSSQRSRFLSDMREKRTVARSVRAIASFKRVVASLFWLNFLKKLSRAV